MRIALLALALIACSTSKTAEHDVHLNVQEDAELDATRHAEIHADEQRQTNVVQQPTTIEVEDFAAGPDGGVVLRRRTRRILGVRETTTGIDRNFVARSDGTDHAEIHVDAGLVEHDEAAKTMKPSAGCALGLGVWGALALVGLLVAVGLYLRVKP